MGVHITTIVYLGVLIIQIGSTIVLMVVEAQGVFGNLGIGSPSNTRALSPRITNLGLAKKTGLTPGGAGCPDKVGLIKASYNHGNPRVSLT